MEVNMTTIGQDELIWFMRVWANDGPHAPRMLDSRSYLDVTMFVCANVPDLEWADYDKALDLFALELHAANRLGDDMRHRVAN
jgi:hypothetical protein